MFAFLYFNELKISMMTSELFALFTPIMMPYIEQEQEKEMTSEQIDRAFEKTDNIAADEIDSFDGDINDFLQE